MRCPYIASNDSDWLKENCFTSSHTMFGFQARIAPRILGRSFVNAPFSTDVAASVVVEPKIKEKFVAREILTMKKNIKGSPQKLNLLAKQVRGMKAEQALVQMQFSHKRKASIVQKTIQNAINLADMNHDIEPNRLRIQKAFVGKGQTLKRIRMMGKGKSGIMKHKFAHLTVVLEEMPPPKNKAKSNTINA